MKCYFFPLSYNQGFYLSTIKILTALYVIIRIQYSGLSVILFRLEKYFHYSNNISLSIDFMFLLHGVIVIPRGCEEAVLTRERNIL